MSTTLYFLSLSPENEALFSAAQKADAAYWELIALFEAAEGSTITVSDENIQELTDSWEDSNSKRTFSMGRGKGTVYSWLLAHRGEKITVSS